MTNSPQFINELGEADFRKIQKLLKENRELDFSLDYIRKVCKAKRHNTAIRKMAENYLFILKEMEFRFKKL